MQAYSPDLRQRVLADCDRGLTSRVVATKYSVSESWVRRLKQRRRQTGETAPRLPGPRRPPQLDAYRDRLQELVAAHPDASLRQLRDRLGVAVCLVTVWAALRRLGLSVKKSPPGGGARPARCAGPTRAVAGRASDLGSAAFDLP
jgi:transposase